jgi:hypothetical protein
MDGEPGAGFPERNWNLGQLVTDRSASLVACVRQWRAWWTVVSFGPGEPKPSLRDPVQISAPLIYSWQLDELRIPHKNALLICQHLVAVIRHGAGYDTTWRYGILRKLHRWNIRASLALILPRLLQGRYSSVRLGNVLSVRYPQENKLQQFSVLSVTLFAISIKGLVNAVGPSVTTSLHVDEVATYYSSRSMGTTERRLQGPIIRLSRWARENFLRYCPRKHEVYIWHAWGAYTLTLASIWGIAFFCLYQHSSSWMSFVTANSPGSLTCEMWTGTEYFRSSISTFLERRPDGDASSLSRAHPLEDRLRHFRV